LESTPRSFHRHLIFPFHYAPKEETIFFVATISDKPGALAAFLSVLSKRVNLIGTSSYSLGGNTAIYSGFGKLLAKHTTASSLHAEIAKSRKVKSCQVWKSRNGLIVDRFHTGFQGGVGEPYLVFPARGLSDTFEGIVRVIGTGGSTLLYDLGLDYAKARSGIYKKMMGAHPESHIDELAAIVTALGYGHSEAALSPDRKSIRITSIECFECSTPSRSGRRCSFLRGMAVGIFGPLFDVDMVSEETKCRNAGDDLCEFVLKAKDGQPLVGAPKRP